jgi:hypothetical protein
MKRRFGFLIAVGIALSSGAHAHGDAIVSKVALVCPDRSPRMADIDMAVKAAHWQATDADHRRMLERTRSVCAAGLSVANLPAPNPELAADGKLVSDTAH